MRRKPIGVIAALLIAASGACAFGQQQAPDEAAVRKSIDELIKGFQDAKKPATVGLIHEAAGRSIEFGAPAWNDGNHKACERFYRKTIESLCVAFGDEKNATPAARPLFKAMRDSLERVRESKDVDRNAWSLRSTFDAAELETTLTSIRITGHVNLGDACLLHGNMAEAVANFEDACTTLNELDGMARPTVARIDRFAPLGLGNALFAQGRYKEASEAIVRGLAVMPHWPASSFDPRSPEAAAAPFDPRKLFGDPTYYGLLMRDLEAKARQHPDDAPMQFLLGYEYFFTEKRDQAKAQFEKTLKLEPSHPGARLFLHGNPEEKPHDERHVPKGPTV